MLPAPRYLPGSNYEKKRNGLKTALEQAKGKEKMFPHLHHLQPLVMHALHDLALHPVVRRPQLLLPVVGVLLARM